MRDPAGKVLGTRRLASAEPDCRSLGEAIAVAMTVAIDPDAPGTRGPLVEATLGNEPPPSPPSPPPKQEPERGHATLATGAGFGLVPGVVPSGSLGVRHRLGESLFSLGLGAHLTPESRKGDFGFALTTASLDVCVGPRRIVVRWCAGGHLGFFHVFAHGDRLAPVEVGMFPWSAAETGPALSLPLVRGITLEMRVTAVLPLVRRQALVLGQAEPVWEQARLGGAAEIGLGTSL